jgi:hypothetical protein
MVKRYSTTLSNGQILETSSAHEAQNFVCYDDSQLFYHVGISVTAAEFFETVAHAVQSAWDKKLETHKRVSVQCGASHLSRVEKWVRR